MSEKRGRGQPKFEPTQDQRSQVKLMKAVGIPEDRICKTITNPRTGKPVAPMTLARAFAPELASGVRGDNAVIYGGEGGEAGKRTAGAGEAAGAACLISGYPMEPRFMITVTAVTRWAIGRHPAISRARRATSFSRARFCDNEASLTRRYRRRTRADGSDVSMGWSGCWPRQTAKPNRPPLSPPSARLHTVGRCEWLLYRALTDRQRRRPRDASHQILIG